MPSTDSPITFEKISNTEHSILHKEVFYKKKGRICLFTVVLDKLPDKGPGVVRDCLPKAKRSQIVVPATTFIK